MGFTGIPRATFDFLAGVQANNTRDWFEAHRAQYERDWLAVGLDLAAALSEPASRIGLMAVPKLNASLRRIHRDTRFSADKRPYHAQLHLILSTGPDFNKVPGVHLVFGAAGWGYGAGHYGFTPQELDRWRGLVSTAPGLAAAQGWLASARAVGCTLDPPDLARVPNGYESAPEWDQLLRRKSMIARTQLPLPVPDWLFGPEAPRQIAQLAAAHVPLLAWLLR